MAGRIQDTAPAFMVTDPISPEDMARLRMQPGEVIPVSRNYRPPEYVAMTEPWLEAVAWEWRRLVQKRWGTMAECEVSWTPSRGLWRASIVLGPQTYRVEARRAPEAMDKALTAVVAAEA